MICLAVCLGFGQLSLAVERIKDELAVLVDKASNSIDKVQP